MKKILSASTFLFVVVNIFANQIEITDYPIGGYSIKELQKAQLDKLASSILLKLDNLKKQIGSDHKIEISIEIVGYADKTGKLSENDRIGEDRARLVKEYLAARISDAKFSTYSRGDEQNARKVSVVWKFSTVALPAQGRIVIQKEKISSALNWLLIGVIALGLMILLVLTLLHLKTKKLPGEIPAKTAFPTRPDRVEFISIELDKRCFKIPVTVKTTDKEEFWITPFPTKQNNSRFLSKRNKHDVKTQLRQCLKDLSYRQIVTDLLKQEIITVE